MSEASSAGPPAAHPPLQSSFSLNHAKMGAYRRRVQHHEKLHEMRNAVSSVADSSSLDPLREDTPLLSQHFSDPGSRHDASRDLFRTEHSGPLTPASDLRYICREMLVGKTLNVLLVLLPLGYLADVLDWGPMAVFLLNFAALIPVASLLGDFTEELAIHTGEVLGGLVNATFGNAVETVISIQALRQDQFQIVQNSLLGSIFSNALLVLGCCFFAAGAANGFSAEPKFNGTAAAANTSVLIMSALAMVLPPSLPHRLSNETQEETSPQSLAISRIAALMLLLVYALLLVFQLYTHRARFAGVEGEEQAAITATAAIIGLAACTVVVTVFSDFLVGSIDGFAEAGGLSKAFVGIVLLPIVGNAVEHLAAVTVAYKQKLDLAVGIALGSSTQVAIFVVPFTIIMGWAMGKPMTFCLPMHEFVLYITMLVVISTVVGNGVSNWMEGCMLVATYALIAIAYFYV